MVLVIGFALHNGTEGFGIVAPFASVDERPSWAFLLLTGLIGGGPTFVGTVIGNAVVNDTLFLLFLALAAGSILYVVVQLLKMASRLGQTEVLMWGLLVGLVLGFGTDYVLVIAGGCGKDKYVREGCKLGCTPRRTDLWRDRLSSGGVYFL